MQTIEAKLQIRKQCSDFRDELLVAEHSLTILHIKYQTNGISGVTFALTCITAFYFGRVIRRFDFDCHFASCLLSAQGSFTTY